MKYIWKLLESSFTAGVVLAVGFAGFAGFLYLLYWLLNRLIKLMRPKEVRQRDQQIMSHRFYRVSWRGRAAYLILCLEEALQFYKQDFTAWEWVLRKLWSITDCAENDWMIDVWLDSVVDLLPRVVLTDNAAEAASADINKARNLYTQAGYAMIVINAILENADAMVGAWSSNTAAHDPDALRYLDKVEAVMRDFGVPLPSSEISQPLFKQKDSWFGAPFDGLRLSRLSKKE